MVNRQETHGKFFDDSFTSQNLKYVLGCGVKYEGLSNVQREALDFICSKLSRIVNGDPSHLDHWLDIKGYCDRVIEDLKGE